MKISTKGRYALRVMIDLAQQGGAGYIPLKDIAQRQGLSEKYLESIVKLLARNGDLAGVRVNCTLSESTFSAIKSRLL